jgi:bacterial/archaeal transporter family protein
MYWFWIALAAPLIWAITNYVDKFLVSQYFKGGNAGALTIFSGLIGFLIAPVILLFKFEEIVNSAANYWLLVASGVLYILWIPPYLYALEKDDASLVIPLFQLVPVFAFVTGWIFLREMLTSHQFLGGSLIIAGAVLISLELSMKRIALKKRMLFLMGTASFVVALYSLFFKIGAKGIDYWAASFWFYLGFGLGGVLFLLYPPFRRQFLHTLQSNRAVVIPLNISNELLNIVGVILINFAFLLSPLALVWVVSGLQPVFVFLIGILLTLFFPKVIKENIARGHLVQKILAILVIFLGSVLVNF